MIEGTIGVWLKKEGERVKEGEPLFEVETDKTSLEVEAKASGILAKILVVEGETVPIGERVALIAGEGESLQDFTSQRGAQSSKESGDHGRVEETESTTEAIQQASKVSLASGNKIKATPAAKRLAREVGIDLSTVNSEYQDGVIAKGAVLAFLKDQSKASPVAQKTISEHDLERTDLGASGSGGQISRQDVEDYPQKRGNAMDPTGEKVVPLEGIRKAIAQRMTESSREAPQVTLTTRVDMKEVIILREKLLALTKKRITYTDILLMVIAKTLKRFPQINAYLENQAIIYKDQVNIGLAVDTPQGLVVPVLKNADQLRIEEMANQRNTLVRKARERRLTPDEMQGGTFTLSNLGSQGVEIFTPILNPPEVAILGVGKISEEPMVVEGKITIRPAAWLSLTFDHRATDGAPAAEFLREIKQVLEEPWLLLL